METHKDRTLENLLEPVTVEHFLNKIWGGQHLVITRNNPGHYQHLFSFADVDRLIFLARDRPQDLLTLLPKDKLGTEIKARLHAVPVHELYRRFHLGDTLRISSIEGSWPALLPLVQKIAETLNARVDVNLYMTPANSQGFPTHVDHEDVFILQVGGSKEWFIYEADFPWPLEGLSYVDKQGGFSTGLRDQSQLRLAERVLLQTGDFLYVPRGYPHHAVTSGLPSLHLTIGIHPTYWLDVARAALELASEGEPALRRALPPRFSASEAGPAMVTELERILHRALEGPVLEKALRAVAANQRTVPDFLPDGHFASLEKLDALTLASIVGHREGMEYRIEREDQQATIRAGRAQIRGPISILPALEFIRDHSELKVAEIPLASDENGKVVLARRLIREGLLRIDAL
jgi:ribosomal protein L16 Arg81 hydroxylase